MTPVEAIGAILDDQSRDRDAMCHPCPSCGVEPGAECLTSDGAAGPGVHVARGALSNHPGRCIPDANAPERTESVVTATDLPRCRSCREPIRWARTTKGRNMPLDRDPVPDGNVVMTGRKVENHNGVLVPEVMVESGERSLFGPESETERYVAHFATCPDSEAHRRSK